MRVVEEIGVMMGFFWFGFKAYYPLLFIVVVFRGQTKDSQTREVGWNKYITITEQIYRIKVLYNS